MSSARRVPETRLLGQGELSAEDAWRALRRYGGWRLLRDALVRFRSGDGFSHARALGLQLCLAGVPLLIALNGLASRLGGLRRGGRVVADTVLALTPGASESLVRQLLAHEERVRHSGQVALWLGLLTAVVALTTAVGQVERGANRIYGVDRDRPALQKYLRALVLTVVAGLPALVSFLLLVAGGAIGASMRRWYHWDTAAVTAWNLLRWPVSLGLIVVTVSLLFRYAPHRRQPGLSWLMVGAGLATVLWWLVSLLLAAYATESRDFGATYGPLTGVMALLLWANLTGVALFVGVAFAAQLEATRVGISGPAVVDQDTSLAEQTETTLTSRT
jgi:YihY family inner membrane protein